MGKQQWRMRKLIDKKQQLRFALELVIYAMLFPMWFLLLSLAAAINQQFHGPAHGENATPSMSCMFSVLDTGGNSLLLLSWSAVSAFSSVTGSLVRFIGLSALSFRKQRIPPNR